MQPHRSSELQYKKEFSQKITTTQIHGWKFAKTINRIPRNFLKVENGILLAGDGFAAGDDTVPADLHPRIESAMLSGLGTANSL
jgi:predicted NAD/FAD-dependent oxidoreductase